MKKNLLHYGLQRSGTNILESLVEKNFKTKFFNSNKSTKHPKCKHFRPYHNKQVVPVKGYKNDFYFDNFNMFLEKLELKRHVDGILVISKDPYSWFISYNNWARKCNWPEVGHHYIEEYNLFYTSWMNFSKQDDRILFIRYIDLLLEPENELSKIKTIFNLEYKIIPKLTGKAIKQIRKVPQSTAFDNSKTEYYLKKGYLNYFTNESLKEINDCLDKSLMKELKYDMIEKV